MLSFLLVLLAACAGGQATTPTTPTTRDSAQSLTGLSAHRNVELHCQQDSDCAVTNIGNCCGTYLACVNTSSTIDPAAVARECADQGLAGICGYPDITACECVQGLCRSADAGQNEEQK